MTNNTEDVELRKQVAEIVEYWDFSPQQDEDSRIERLRIQIEALIQQEANRQKLELLDKILSYGRGKTILDTAEGWQQFLQKYIAYIEAERRKLEKGLGDE